MARGGETVNRALARGRSRMFSPFRKEVAMGRVIEERGVTRRAVPTGVPGLHIQEGRSDGTRDAGLRGQSTRDKPIKEFMRERTMHRRDRNRNNRRARKKTCTWGGASDELREEMST